jgi:hypothetical protein
MSLEKSLIDGGITTMCNGKENNNRPKYCKHSPYYDLVECPVKYSEEGYCKAKLINEGYEVRLFKNG